MGSSKTMISPGKSWMLFAAVVATLLVSFGVEGMQAWSVHGLCVVRPLSIRTRHTTRNTRYNTWSTVVVVVRLSRKAQNKICWSETET